MEQFLVFYEKQLSFLFKTSISNVHGWVTSELQNSQRMYLLTLC